jgi:hypothetical protein
MDACSSTGTFPIGHCSVTPPRHAVCLRSCQDNGQPQPLSRFHTQAGIYIHPWRAARGRPEKPYLIFLLVSMSVAQDKMQEIQRVGVSEVPSRMSNVARERAPIAAEFEDCTQRFDRLNQVMEVNEQVWEPYQMLLNDYRSRLTIWGTDTGAKSRTIDHTLRKSSPLQLQALRLLDHLRESLQDSQWFSYFILSLTLLVKRSSFI